MQDLHDQGAIPLLVGKLSPYTHIYYCSERLNVWTLLSLGLLNYLLQLSGVEILTSQEGVAKKEDGVGRLGSGDCHPEYGLLLDLQSDILLIISCLCETDIHRKVSWVCTIYSCTVSFHFQELFGGYDGVKFLISYLQRADRSSLTSGLGYHRLLLAATDCVWCTVVGNPVVEDIFLEEGGVFCLLDLLQVSKYRMCDLQS